MDPKDQDSKYPVSVRMDPPRDIINSPEAPEVDLTLQEEADQADQGETQAEEDLLEEVDQVDQVVTQVEEDLLQEEMETRVQQDSSKV